MATSKKDMEAHMRYAKKALRRLTIDFPISEFESAKKYADEHGTTVTGLIRQLLKEKIGEK